MAVHEIGRLMFLVDSHSRDGMMHLVDLEPDLLDDGTPDPHGEPWRCSCEAFSLRTMRPCRHGIEVLEYLLPVVEHLKHWQPKKKVEPPKQTKRNYTIKLHQRNACKISKSNLT